MKKQSRNFGIIGAGLIAEFHAKAIQMIPDAKIIGFCDNGSGKSKLLANKYDCMAFDGFYKLIDHPDVNILTIASPSGAHMQPVLYASERGKHVICEKPMEIEPERIDKMIEAHQKSGTLLGGIFNYRYDPAVRVIKDALNHGRLGKLTYAAVHVPWWRSDEYYKNNWHGTWNLDGGGALMNQSIHMIDLLQYFMGDVSDVKAFAKSSGHDIEVEDVAAAAILFKNGALGSIYGTTASYPGRNRRIEITGTEGTIEMVEDKIVTWDCKNPLPEDQKIKAQFDKQSEGGGVSDPGAIAYDGHVKNIKAFVSALENNRPFEIDGYEAKKSVSIIHEIYKSAGLIS
jgi:predicted dehydrogenase